MKRIRIQQNRHSGNRQLTTVARTPGLRAGTCSIVRRAFTLVEMLIVILLISILASATLISTNSSTSHSLEANARMLVADLRLARNHAIKFNTEYTVDFDLKTQTYEILHTGAGDLPVPRNTLAGTAADKEKYIQAVQKDALNVPDQVVIRDIRLKTSDTAVSDLAFGSMGGTGPGRSEDTEIILSTTKNGTTFSIPITVSWITGQAWVEEIQTN